MSNNRSTSEDVAQLAGVSQSTVSRVFSNSKRISDATREKVFQAADELGYRPNHLARSLITNKSQLIGIVMAGIDTAFAPYILKKLTLSLQAIGYKTLLFNVGDARSADDLLPHALDYQVDGLITTSAIVSEEMAEVCARFETPLILFNRAIASHHVNSVNADNFHGGQLVADAMFRAGIQRPVLITGPENTSTSQYRRRGFEEGLAKYGYESPIKVVGDLSYESAFEVTCDLMQQSERPDGIFAASDLMAMGVMDALRYELGYQVPNDIQVIGFDGLPATERLSYQLTTIRIDFDLMIEEALDLLLRNIDEPNHEPEQILVPVKYVERSSLITKQKDH